MVPNDSANTFHVFLGATKHLYNWLCPSVGWSVGLLVGRVTHPFDDLHVAPYWPTWPCFRYFHASLSLHVSIKELSLFITSVM